MQSRIAFLLALTGFAFSLQAAAPNAPSELKVDNMVNPLCIDTAAPRFSWVVNDPDRGEVQSAYQINVESVDPLGNVGASVWNSGKMASDQQSFVRYGGTPLSQRTKYRWRVMTWDKDGNSSPYSADATFETGLFGISGWNSTGASWIGGGSQSAAFARRELTIDAAKTITAARMYIAAVGNGVPSYQLRINGSRVGDDSYAPGPTESMRALFNAFDVTSLLHPGANAMGVIYMSKFSIVLTIDFTDGTRQTIVSDATSWKCAGKGPFTNVGLWGTWAMNPLSEIEEYDARNEYTGWDMPGYNQSAWTTAGSSGAPSKLAGRRVPCKILATLSPVSIANQGGGRFTVNFGQNVNGHVRLTLTGASGQTVRVRYAETVDGSGNISQGSIQWDAHNTYTCKNNSAVTVEPIFFNVGFQYAEVTGYPGTLTADNIRSVGKTSDIQNGSIFECSDATLNKLQTVARWSFLNNAQNIPTDCPGRERRGWTMDAWCWSEAGCMNFDMLNFYYKWFDDYVDNQNASGWVRVELPMSSDPNTDVKWPVASLGIPWDVYQAYGDTGFISRYYAMGKKYVNYLQSVDNSDYSFNYGGQYAPYVAYNGDWVARESPSPVFSAMCHYFRAADLVSRFAAILGNAADSVTYATLASNIRQSITTKFFHSTYYDANTQSANAQALGLRVVADASRSAVLQSIMSDYTAKNANTSGCLGIHWVLPALAEGGRNDIAYSFVKNPNVGGWVNMINKGATTLWEGWNGGSRDHAFLGGSLSQWLYQELAGIAAVKPGYKEIRIRPYVPSDVSWAKAEINTVRGWVKSYWQKLNGGNFQHDITIPPNAIATVYVPGTDTNKVCESGRLASRAAGVSFLRSESGYLVYSVGSGTYQFTYGLPPVGILNKYTSLANTRFLFGRSGRTCRITVPVAGIHTIEILNTQGRIILSRQEEGCSYFLALPQAHGVFLLRIRRHADASSIVRRFE